MLLKPIVTNNWVIKKKKKICSTKRQPDQTNYPMGYYYPKLRVKGAFLEQLIVIPIVQVVLAGNAGLEPVTCDVIHQELKCNLNYSQNMLSGVGM